MKTLNKVVCALILAAGIVSCNKAEFHTTDFVTLGNARYTVKDDGSELKIPVLFLSDAARNTTVTYTINNIDATEEDYILESASGVLNISSDPNAKNDSIVVRTIDRTGELQGNKKFSIVLNAVTESGVQLGNTSSCTVTIIDSDGGLNLLFGDWLGSDMPSSRNPVSLSFNLVEVPANDPGLEDFPEANIKIAAGHSTATDAMGNTWSFQVDVYAFFDDNKSTLNIYPDQVFDAGNFGDDVGVLYVGFDNGAGTDIILNVEEGLLTLTTDVYFLLYNEDGSASNYTCGKILSGGQIVKQ